MAKKRPNPMRKQSNSHIALDERNLVSAALVASRGELSQMQMNGLQKVLRRPKKVIANLVQEAKEDFAAAAGKYVEIHRMATEQALANEDFETALKGSQWAIQNIGFEGAAVTEAKSAGPAHSRVMIGINVGGIQAPNTVIDLPTESE